jgi:uncharacterized protein (UPF0333 family)
MSTIFGGVKLKFKKGILVEMEDMGFTNTGDSTDGGSRIPALSGNANKFLQVASTGAKMQWTTLYAPTTTGTDGQVWTSTGSGGNWESLPAQIPAFSTSNSGQVLKVNSSGNLYWGTDNNTTYTTATFASASHNHDDSYSAIGHTHSSYVTSSGTVANANKVKCNSGNRGYAVTADGDGGYSTMAQTSYANITGSSSRRFKHDIGKYALDTTAFYNL